VNGATSMREKIRARKLTVLTHLIFIVLSEGSAKMMKFKTKEVLIKM
jgi:hypothetical protein